MTESHLFKSAHKNSRMTSPYLYESRWALFNFLVYVDRQCDFSFLNSYNKSSRICVYYCSADEAHDRTCRMAERRHSPYQPHMKSEQSLSFYLSRCIYLAYMKSYLPVLLIELFHCLLQFYPEHSHLSSFKFFSPY